MFQQLFKSDKAPFILSLTLSVLAWLVATTISNFSDVIVLGIDRSQSGAQIIFTITNYSLKKPLAGGVISFTCAQQDCLDQISPNVYAFDTNVRPYQIQGNRICTPSENSIYAIINLPPKATMRYEMKLKGANLPEFAFNGILPDDQTECPDSNSQLKIDNILIEEGYSLLLALIKYYDYILVTFIIITLVFLISILARVSIEKNGRIGDDS